MFTKSQVRILLADDHPVVRDGLRLLLEAAGDIRVVGEAENGRQAVQLCKTLQPDIALIDIAMPVLNGFEATRQILKEVPGTKVLILSSYGHDDYIRAMVEQGASGYVVKQSAVEDLLNAVREVQKGKIYFSPSITRRLDTMFKDVVNGRPRSWDPVCLSSRETEVLQLVAEGNGNKQIADLLGISVKTVEKHRQQLMEKLNLHETASLTRYAIAKGLVETAPPLKSAPEPQPAG